jgi:glucose/arabinose dehydrogenase
MARAKLTIGEGSASLDGLQVLWHDMPKGRGGRSAVIAFSPDGQYLFLAVGDRQRMTPAQDPNTQSGQILRLTLDEAAPGTGAGKTGATSLPLIDPPRDTEVANRDGDQHTNRRARTWHLQTWSMGHRTPYGLAFAPDGSCGTRTRSAGRDERI